MILPPGIAALDLEFVSKIKAEEGGRSGAVTEHRPPERGGALHIYARKICLCAMKVMSKGGSNLLSLRSLGGVYKISPLTGRCMHRWRPNWAQMCK